MVDCDYWGIRDCIVHGSERHDEYCYLHETWCPSCKGCRHNTDPQGAEKPAGRHVTATYDIASYE